VERVAAVRVVVAVGIEEGGEEEATVVLGKDQVSSVNTVIHMSGAVHTS